MCGWSHRSVERFACFLPICFFTVFAHKHFFYLALSAKIDCKEQKLRRQAKRKPHLMPFDLETWKARMPAQLRGWRKRMQKAKAESAYAFLAAATLWPVVQAAREGDWSALTVLGEVVSGAERHVLIERLPQWQDETEAAREIAAIMGGDQGPELRVELDAVLGAVRTLELAQRGLRQTTRAWFAEALRRDGVSLDASQTMQANLRGSGAIAQGTGSLAVGQGGIAITGNVYTGPPIQDPEVALAIYRRVLMESCRHLTLRGLDMAESDVSDAPRRLDLHQIYVDLLTATQVPVRRRGQRRRKRPAGLLEEGAETRPLRALEAVVQERQVVLLGEPGSGKSTFLTYVAFCLAAHGIAPEQQWHEHLPGWPEREAHVVPLTVVLRDFARWLPEAIPADAPRHLWSFLTERLETQNLAFAADPLHDCLERGDAILFLDGLDEIPTPKQRGAVRDATVAFIQRYPHCRVVVTCRTLSYQDPAWQLKGVPSHTLAPFHTRQIEQFIAAWYNELARQGSMSSEAVDASAQHLQMIVRRPDLRSMASNPLLLTVIALVHTHRGRLPEARALLYEETVDILLWRWEQIKVSGEELSRLRRLLTDAGRTDVDLKRALWRLAFEAHERGGTDDAAAADIGELEVRKRLAGLHPETSWDWVSQVIEVMKQRAGLLMERIPDVYAFPHRTFQEYLAGAYLATQGNFAAQAAQLGAGGAFWREVILLGVGRLVHVNGEIDKPSAVLEELCPVEPLGNEAEARQASLAGEVLLEMGPHRLEEGRRGRSLGERVRQQLVRLLQAGYLSAVERVRAGDTLARLGDLRFRADAWHLPDEPLLGFVEIPAGPFWMGSSERDEEVGDDERPQHEVTLSRYWIARYPVTVAQFQAFVAATGYAWGDQDREQGPPTHPVVWVTWHDALAYCQWLGEVLGADDAAPEPLRTLLRDGGWHVTLPSEVQWEKAARGAADQRRYPWGERFEAERVNSVDAGVGRTSAVGCFPQGASPYGCLDMAGNVWEWARSLRGEAWQKSAFGYPYDAADGREDRQAPDEVLRVLRGGAFVNDSPRVRCAFRGWSYARVADHSLGFRVVLSALP